MGLFKRKKKTVQPINYDTKVFQSTLNIFSDFGNNINASDVVKICIDRIATHAAKLKPRYVKNLDNSSVVEKKGTLAFLLKYAPNPLMTPYDFIYRVVTLLYLNNNAFIYPLYDENTYELKELWPIKPNAVEALKDNSGALFLRFSFVDGNKYTLPYESIIHLRRFYGVNDIFGGSGAISDHSAILKTIKINDSVLQGIDNAIRSSFQIKGLLKINAMLSEKDKKAQKEEFDRALKEASTSGNSAIVPVDLKSDYVPLSVDPKLVSSETLTFLQKKIITYFGVSEAIYDNKYTEDEYNAFYEGTIEGIAIALSETFSRALLTRNNLENGEQIIFYSERLQYASWNTKVSAIEKLMGLGILSLNESRSLLGLEPIEGGDKRLQSLNYVDADSANKYQVGEEPKEEEDDKE
ncbi:MAG: phage portal protein [Sulfurimonas sp.]|jgi:HK97 family phage portal protein|nr:phage portal protein [Bacillota bacterium]MDY0122047.1 phage portal protein [Sulfurimonas sp.]HOA10820.1 phage portal protein [Bacilli bacterium]TAH59205.1 MAG: phage portal protein [Bacillota bacterium]HOH94576.1 phage portal protein [Bacilli bacterium]